MTRLRKQNGRARALEGHVLGPGQRDGRPLADGPPQRRGLRQVRAGSRQADEVDRPQRQADRRRLVQFRRRRRLDRLEPHRPRFSESTTPTICRCTLYVGQSRQRFRRFPGQFARTGPAHQDRRGHHRRGAFRPAEPAGAIYIAWDEWNVWYRARGERQARAGAFWRSTTTWKTRWWSRPF